MQQDVLDRMVEYSVAEIASGDLNRINSLTRRLAKRWESESALAICFAMTSAASILEDQFANQEIYSRRAYMLSSLIAADIFALESLGQFPAKGHHLLAFWRRADPFFLEF